MKAKIRTEVRHHIVCPNCEADIGTVDHLASGRFGSFGPWYCDECGTSVTGKVHSATDVDISVSEDRIKKTFVLLALPPQDEHVYFMVASNNVGRPNEPIGEGDRYLFEEHSCPTNYIRCESIAIGDDDDPHGLFEYVSTIERPKDWDRERSTVKSIFEAFPALMAEIEDAN